MRRSAVANHDIDHSQPSTTTIASAMNTLPQKRSLEDYGFLTNLKRRRHLSPQNANIERHDDVDIELLTPSKKKTRAKSRNQSILESSMETAHEHSSLNDTYTSRKASSRQTMSSQQMNEINLPTWEGMCPHIDQILSNKHTQSGVFAHEVQLVQQELEALLAMSIVRENILKDLHTPAENNTDTVRSKIRKHQEAERLYSTKKVPKKRLPSLVNHQHQRQAAPQQLLDRQVAMTPILGARIDQIWTDLSTHYRQISSDDISSIGNLVDFHRHLETNLQQYKSDYAEQSAEQARVLERLNEENYERLVQISQTTPLVTHYVDRTSIGAFQAKIYQHMGQTSPVYQTPISSPMHGRMLSSQFDFKDHAAALRISPRLHSNEQSNGRTGLFALPNVKLEDDVEVATVSIKSKKKSKVIPSPSSAIKLQQRLQYVQNYLIDQHPLHKDAVKRQLFHEVKPSKKRKTSLSITIPATINNHDHCTDAFQSKLSTLLSLLNECSTISSCALKRARLQSDNEHTWQKLRTIERDVATLVGKLNNTGGQSNHSSTTEKAFHNLAQFMSDWQKHEEEFDQQLEELRRLDP